LDVATYPTAALASDIGGAIAFLGLQCDDARDIRVLNCTFKHCQAKYQGGALYISLLHPAIEQSLFLNNRALLSDGGAISISECSRTSVTACSFVGCRANGIGGAVSVQIEKAVLALHNTQFHGMCGVCNCHRSDAPNSTLRHADNSATTGGALGVSSSRTTDCLLQVECCEFLRNKAELGGALALLQYASPTIVDCWFGYNNATDKGGAMLLMAHSNASFTRSNITNNQAATGGGVCIEQYSSGLYVYTRTNRASSTTPLMPCVSMTKVLRVPH
jgi:hypothetical protein